MGGSIGQAFGTILKPFTGEKAYDAQGVSIDAGAFNPNEQEKKLTDALLARAMGESESPAALQMQMGLEQAARQAQAQAAAARGVSPALAARLASQTGAQMRSDAVGQSALARMQEQARSEQAAGAMLGDQRQARAAREELGVRQQMGLEGMRQQSSEAGMNRLTNVISGAGQAAVLAASDKRMKKNVKSGDKEVKSFLSALKAQQYEYNNPSYGKGKHVSPMAQDIEKTAIGRQMVIDTPAGKIVDYGKGLGAMLAAQAHLNERLEKVEKKKMNQGGLVIPQRYQGFGSTIQQPTTMPDLAGDAGKGMDQDQLAMLNKFLNKPAAPSTAGAMQGTSVNLTPTAPTTNFMPGANAAPMMLASQGAMVPGRAKVAGDSEANDTVPALLSPGEMILPRTVVQAGPQAIKSFAESILEKEKKKGKT